jgi:hypothetical protein
MKSNQIEYTDVDGNEFVLTPYEYTTGLAACVGCVCIFGNSIMCRRLPSCTPESLRGRGRHVWTYKRRSSK